MMKALKRFDTPIKRLSFIGLVVGVATLVVSLTVWTKESRRHKVYYTQAHYSWVPVDLSYKGKVERSWTWSRECRRSYGAARQPRTIVYRAPVRESDVRRNMNSISNMGAHLLVLGVGKPKKDARTDQEKFRDSLYSKLGLTTLPADERDVVFEKCIVEENVGHKKTKTTHHSNLGSWLSDHPVPFWLGMVLSIVGFMGSYGNRTTFNLFQGTVGRLLSWVRTGDWCSKDSLDKGRKHDNDESTSE